MSTGYVFWDCYINVLCFRKVAGDTRSLAPYLANSIFILDVLRDASGLTDQKRYWKIKLAHFICLCACTRGVDLRWERELFLGDVCGGNGVSEMFSFFDSNISQRNAHR